MVATGGTVMSLQVASLVGVNGPSMEVKNELSFVTKLHDLQRGRWLNCDLCMSRDGQESEVGGRLSKCSVGVSFETPATRDTMTVRKK